MLGLFKKKPAHQRERRRLIRLPEDNAMFVIDDVSYALADWSIEGFRALGYRGGRSVGQEGKARLIILHKGSPVGFDIRVKVLRENRDQGEIAGQFLSMSTAARKEMARIYRERLAAYQLRHRAGEKLRV